ncbi:MAG: T9SS type A sorting domain-containing protein [Crocinitomicaceae bacterium]|nr:T9SS type A sorting domain-containing protein [Flavobacteriales bacterium]NQZ36829.1 T9SS type A sorting domain-containing protein [Crocinitomicaceae bacterium]
MKQYENQQRSIAKRIVNWQRKLMYKAIAFSTLSISLLSTSFAQTTDIYDSLTQTPQQQFDFIAQNLDLSEVTTGFLLDKAMPMIAIENFDGQQLSTDNLGTTFDFCKLYATLSSMSINSNFSLPDPNSYTSLIENPQITQIQMGVIAYEYNQLREDALTQNLLTTNGTQFFDVLNRPQSPYLQKEVFLASPMKQGVMGLIQDFILPSALMHTNSTKVIANIQMDFDDGLGFRNVIIDQGTAVTYSQEGIKIIKTKINYTDLSSLIAHGEIEVFEMNLAKYNWSDTIPVNIELELTADIAYSGEYGKAKVTVLLACGHTDIQKPLIFVEGFNPPVSGLGIPYEYTYMNGILLSGKIGEVSITEFCDEEGYDLIYVDFEDGGDYMQKNAYVVQKVISWANEQKVANGSTEKNVVIGESMGGVIAKYALRTMELAGVDHETDVYMSIDSPHQGANVPLSFQYAVKHIPYIKFSGHALHTFFPEPVVSLSQKIPFGELIATLYKIPTGPELMDILAGEKLLNTRAAKQMLLYQAPDDFSNQTGTSLKSIQHIAFYGEYEALGDLENCETYMMSDGSSLGSSGGQEFDPYDEILKLDFNGGDIDNLIIENVENGGLGLLHWFTGGKIEFHLNALPDYSVSNKRIYKGFLEVRILHVVGIAFSNKTVKVKEVYPYDSSPGGRYDLSIVAEENLDSVPILKSAIDGGNIAVNISGFNFVPTFSSLDMPPTYKVNPYAPFTNLNLINSQSSAFRSVLFDGVYSTTGVFLDPLVLNNYEHTALHNNSADWFHLHLIGNDEINDAPIWSSGSFNFGEGNFGGFSNYTNTDFKRTSSKIDSLDRITGTGKVYVNMNNKIGNIGTGLGAYTVLGTPSDPTNFIVSIKPKCYDSTKTLLVDAGGIFHIGYNEDHKGEVHILEGAELRIGNGGSLYIKENSKLVIHRGAKLIFEDGGFISNEGKIEIQGVYDGDLETWFSGELEYHDGADLKMEHEFAEIDFNGGNLMIKENATFKFRHNTGPSGFLRFSTRGKHIFGETNSRFQIKGDGTTDVIVLIEEGADLLSNNVLDFIKIDKGRVVFRENARLASIVPYYSDDVTYQGLFENRGLHVFKYSHIINANFDEVPIRAPLFYGGTGSLNLYNSVVNNSTSETAIYVNGGSYKIGNTQINANHFHMINSLNMIRPALLFNSVLTSNHDNGAVTIGVQDYSSVQLSMSGNTLNGNYVGAFKLEGALKLSCNDFNSFVYGGVFGYNNTKVRMNSWSRAGYNHFTPANNSALSVYLNGAREINLHKGYNVFDEDISSIIVSGTIRPFFLISSISGIANKWNLSGTLPSPGFTNIVNELGPGMPIVPVDATGPDFGTCGQHYPAGGGIILTGGTATGNTNSQVQFSFGFVTVDDAIEMAILEMEEFNNNGDDIVAIDMLSEILMYNYPNVGNDLDALLNEAQSYMEQTLRHAFDTETITVSSNMNGFEPSVQQYVNTLNKRGQTNINSVNYYQQFEIEMKKAHLFHLLGNRDLAFQVLVNTEACGVLETEQIQINHWKKVFQEEKAKISYGFEAESIDSNWVDTSSYKQPQQQQQFGNFGTLIQSPTSVLASSCNQIKSLNPGIYNKREITVYPNPADNELFMINDLDEGSTGGIVIHSLLGQHMLSLDCRAGENTTLIDVSSFSSGSYIYLYYVDGVLEDKGKLIIQN